MHLDNPLSVHTPTSLWQKVLFLWQEFFTATPRTQQAQELSTWLVGLGGEGMILGGDFNSMPFAGADRHLRQYFSDALSSNLQQYFTGTYWGRPHNPVLPRLDFLYYSPYWQIVDAQVIQQKASGSFPRARCVVSRFASARIPRRHSTTQRYSPARPHAGSNPAASTARRRYGSCSI